MTELIGALDQGTTSTRFMIFDPEGNVISRSQLPHEQILPAPGWVEHNPIEILEKAETVIQTAMSSVGLQASDLSTIGITNQRETSIVWNPSTGQPYGNAIVWQDTRNENQMRELDGNDQGQLIRERTGVPPTTYFSAGKVQWILENVAGIREAAERGQALFGTVDAWLVWNLTGGTSGGIHATDVTNASRTMLMDLKSLDWNEELLEIFRFPKEFLPEILPSSGFFGETTASGPLKGRVPITGVIGDQQAATVGQVCFTPGESKNTYGTGNFMLMNTGTEIVRSKAGLLTTVCYKMADSDPVYALEGSIAVTGSAVQWLRDQVGLIQTSDEIESLAKTVENNGGIYFVPAFSGLFAPYWRSDARGVIVGLSRFTDRGHLARATLESICYQTRDVLEAMRKDAGIDIEVIRVDGGATVNKTLMQLQADIIGVPVVRPKVAETTSLGAAYCAGLARGIWADLTEARKNWKMDQQWDPQWSASQRDAGYAGWQKAVNRSLGWTDGEE